jgi:hypothetical protein
MVASTLVLIAINIAMVARVAAGFTWLRLLGSIVLAAGTAAWAAAIAAARRAVFRRSP